MQGLKVNELEIRVTKGPQTLIEWLGISNARDPGLTLIPYLDQVTKELDCEEVFVDFSKLEYINSSTVPPIIRLIKELDKKAIKTHVIYNKSLKWQQESFKALATLSKILKHVNVEAR
jgi:hypothetical protein